MPSFCCVVKCGSRGDRDNVRFFRIPAELNFPHKPDLNKLSRERRRKWLLAIKREDFTETKLKYALVGSKHFISGKPASLSENNSPDSVPSLQLGYQRETSVRAEERYERAVKRAKVLEQIDQPGPSSEQSTEFEADLVEQEEQDEQNGNMKINKTSQTDITAVEFSDMVVSLSSGRPIGHVCRSEISYNLLRDNDNKTKYYTGFNSFKKLEVIVKYCKDYISASVNTVLDAPNQILLTLMKLRLNLDFKDLGFRFNIHPSTASKYFHSVINVMYLRFKKCIAWCGRDIIKKTTPSFFRDSFGTKVVVIIDSFELFIEKPSNFMKAAQCWSNYKHAYTVKYLIGITPQGTICFISEAWGGRASDKHVTIHSKFLDNIFPGDLILADRGFLVKDYVNILNADIKIPAFTKGQTQLHPCEIEETRSIAHVRIHVERIIGYIKQKFRILVDEIPITFASSGDDDPILDKVLVVCCAMINLSPPIVSL